MFAQIETLLGNEANELLNYQAKGVPKTSLHLPGADFVDRIFTLTDRPIRVLGSLQQVFMHGRLAGTGYLSILPVDQGIEHSAGASFAANPVCFDPEGIIQINKRAGGMGLISGRKAFQKPLKDGVALLNAIQDVYLCRDVTVA